MSTLPSPQMGLWGRITQKIGALLNPQLEQPLLIGTHAEARQMLNQNYGFGSLCAYAFQKMKIESGRLASYRDYDQMDSVPEVHRALTLTAEFSTQSDDADPESFRIVCPDKNLHSYLQSKVEQLRLHQLATPAAREVLKYGCCFWELIADSGGAGIVGVNPLSPGSMVRNEDAFGQLATPAFQQQDLTATRTIAKFDGWQIVHVRYQEESGRMYGNSMLEPARRVFKQLQLMEDGAVTARLYRSHCRFAFFVPVEGMTQVDGESYIERLRNKFRKRSRYNAATGRVEQFDSPMTSEEDIWLSVRKDAPNGDVKVLQGAGNLGQLADVEHFQNKLFAALGVPAQFLGFQRDQGAKANTAEQFSFWARGLRRLQQVMNQGITEVLRRCMIVDGLNSDAEWSVAFPAISSRNEQRQATVLALRTDISVALLSAGLADHEFVFKHVLELPENEVARLLALKTMGALMPTDSAGAANAPGLPRIRSLYTGMEQ